MEEEFYEMDIYQIANQIFSKPPKEAKSIQFMFDTTPNDMKTCFQSLLTFFTEGMKKLYGDQNGKVNLAYITDSQFDTVKEYFASIGIRIHIKTYSLEQLQTMPPSRMPEYSQQLTDYVFNLTTPEGTGYSIQFSLF